MNYFPSVLALAGACLQTVGFWNLFLEQLLTQLRCVVLRNWQRK